MSKESVQSAPLVVEDQDERTCAKAYLREFVLGWNPPSRKQIIYLIYYPFTYISV